MPKNKSKKAPPGEWVGTAIAAAALGVTPDFLRKSLRQEMKPGTHYLTVSRRTARRPSYRWNIAACKDFLAQQLKVR